MVLGQGMYRTPISYSSGKYMDFRVFCWIWNSKKRRRRKNKFINLKLIQPKTTQQSYENEMLCVNQVYDLSVNHHTSTVECIHRLEGDISQTLTKMNMDAWLQILSDKCGQWMLWTSWVLDLANCLSASKEDSHMRMKVPLVRDHTVPVPFLIWPTERHKPASCNQTDTFSPSPLET